MIIKPLNEIDHKEWLPLWKAYQSFYKVELNEEVNDLTWKRLIDPHFKNMYGFAVLLNNKVVGIVHVIEHESCWTIEPYAYLQDLYVDEDYRGRGVARLLIEHVYGVAKHRGCDRVYWLTHESNKQARHLYDRVAKQTGFIQYRNR